MNYLITCCSILLYCSASVRADTVLRRDGFDPVQGTILSGGTTGLQIEGTDDSFGILLIPWSSIFAIESDKPTPGLAIFLQRGEALWRAKQRLLRGDIQLAEPLFASSFADLVGTNGFDALLAAEGLLRCAIARGELAAGVHPWLEIIRLSALQIAQPFPHLEPVLDPSTMLCPHLPPVWLHNQLLRNICQSYNNQAQDTLTSIVLILTSTPATDDTTSVVGVDDPLFLTQILAASKGIENAMELLLERVDSLLPWKQAWVHYFVSVGYFSKQTVQARTTGMLHLAHVAAKSQATQPWLAGASMLRLSDELERGGSIEESQRIYDEVIRYFPTHPLLSHDEYQIRNSVR